MAFSGRYVIAVVAVYAVLAHTVDSHGFMTDPRPRGALKTQRAVEPKEMDPSAPLDYCPHCLNAGGTGAVKKGGPWTKYEPMKSSRKGFGLCGDPEGGDDHMKAGKFANPASMPYVRKYKPGSVANFGFDATTNHNGYLEFYLCDVSKMPDEDLSWDGFAEHCHYLERSPHESCESGNDKECGPIDPKFPGRWVLPCRNAGGEQGDQLLGGEDGKMAYNIPNVEIEMGVIQMYWLTQNSCNDPDGFMDNYKYPKAWAGCPGDGGSVGGKPNHEKCGSGGFPEEFWNCADVQVTNSGGDGTAPTSSKAPSSTAPSATTKSSSEDSTTTASNAEETTKTTNDDSPTGEENNDGTDENNDDSNDSSCSKEWSSCTIGTDTCCGDYVCGSYWGSESMCHPKGEGESNQDNSQENTDDGANSPPSTTTTSSPSQYSQPSGNEYSNDHNYGSENQESYDHSGYGYRPHRYNRYRRHRGYGW